MTEERLTKRQKRLLRQNGESDQKISFKSPNFNLKRVSPLTENQKLTFNSVRV